MPGGPPPCHIGCQTKARLKAENARLREALEGLVSEARDAYDGIDAVGRSSFYHALEKAEAALKEGE